MIFRLQGTYPSIVKATVFGVFEDLKFEISEGSAVSAKLRQPTGQTQNNFNFGRSLLKF